MDAFQTGPTQEQVGDLSRREMLGAVGGSIAVGALHDVAAAQHSKPPIDVCFISEPTAHHRTSYLNVLAKLDGVRSVAVADHTGRTLADAKKRLGKRFREPSYKDHSKMLKAVRPQLTVVTMEGVNAPNAVISALNAGSHVLTEKPSCTKLEQFEQIAQVAEQQKRHVMLAMATRSSNAIKKARQLIGDGVIGKPYSVSLLWIADQTRLKSPSYHKSWVADPKRAGGGKLIYHGIHFLDVCQHLFDQSIREINGFTQNVGGQPIKVEDSAVVSFRLAGGATGTLNTGYYLDRSKQTEIRIWGSHGWLNLQLHERKPLQWYSTKPDQPREIQTFDYSDEAGLYDLFFEDVINSVRNNSRPPITTEESLQALRTVFAADGAVESGKTVSIGR